MRKSALYLISAFWIVILLFSCKNKEIKYSGFDDLVIGTYSIILYENGEFKFELGLGYHDGKYKISNDTVFLTYEDETNKMPKELLITDSCFYIIDTTNYKGASWITRTK